MSSSRRRREGQWRAVKLGEELIQRALAFKLLLEAQQLLVLLILLLLLLMLLLMLMQLVLKLLLLLGLLCECSQRAEETRVPGSSRRTPRRLRHSTQQRNKHIKRRLLRRRDRHRSSFGSGYGHATMDHVASVLAGTTDDTITIAATSSTTANTTANTTATTTRVRPDDTVRCGDEMRNAGRTAIARARCRQKHASGLRQVGLGDGPETAPRLRCCRRARGIHAHKAALLGERVADGAPPVGLIAQPQADGMAGGKRVERLQRLPLLCAEENAKRQRRRVRHASLAVGSAR